jgi:hypothetical protein
VGVTTRVDWLPTDLQASFVELVEKRILISLNAIEQRQRGGNGAKPERAVLYAMPARSSPQRVAAADSSPALSEPSY